MYRQPDVRTNEKGHKKLTADRADLGVYLGPSEDYPAHVTYVAKRGFTVSAHCDFDEKTFPGVKSVASTDWSRVLKDGPLASHADTIVERSPAPPVSRTAPRAAGAADPSAADQSPVLPVADASVAAPLSRELHALAGTGNDGEKWQPATPALGRDGRAKRDTAMRRRISAIAKRRMWLLWVVQPLRGLLSVLVLG